MPVKNSTKIYVEDGFYHAYNRGVEKRVIFLDEQDFRTFLYFLKYYLAPPDPGNIKQTNRSLYDNVKLIAFCLMPNHYHLLLKQTSRDGMTKLIRAVTTSYSGYFNPKYDRVGVLFEGKYKAALIDSDMYLLQSSKYIHRNPDTLSRVGPWARTDSLERYPYSSYGAYLGHNSLTWLQPQEVLSFFASTSNILSKQHLSYRGFVEQNDETIADILGEMALDSAD